MLYFRKNKTTISAPTPDISFDELTDVLYTEYVSKGFTVGRIVISPTGTRLLIFNDNILFDKTTDEVNDLAEFFNKLEVM